MGRTQHDGLQGLLGSTTEHTLFRCHAACWRCRAIRIDRGVFDKNQWRPRQKMRSMTLQSVAQEE